VECDKTRKHSGCCPPAMPAGGKTAMTKYTRSVVIFQPPLESP